MGIVDDAVAFIAIACIVSLIIVVVFTVMRDDAYHEWDYPSCKNCRSRKVRREVVDEQCGARRWTQRRQIICHECGHVERLG